MPPEDHRVPDSLAPGTPVVLVALVAVVLPLLACGLTDLGRDDQAPVQTSELEYTLREAEGGGALEVEIPFRFENRTGDEICLTNCNGGYAVALVHDAGERVWSPVLPACLSAPITIEPGETFRDTLEIFHGLEPHRFPKFEGDPEGIFRLDIVAAGHPGSGTSCRRELPAEERISNRFRLVRE